MIIENVIKVAEKYLTERTIKDAVIGISLIAVELDNGDIGVSYVLRESLPAGCSSFPYAQELVGSNALEVIHWVLNGKDDLQGGIGIAVLTAGASAQDLTNDKKTGTPFGIEVKLSDRVGMIGNIAPVARILKEKVSEIIIFDMGEEERSNNSDIYPMDQQLKLLPTCDIVILSGTTMINGTIDALLKVCKNARDIVMVGPSTPMFPEAFKDSGLTVLAGSCWNKIYKEEIFKSISLACGIRTISKYMIKKAVKCK